MPGRLPFPDTDLLGIAEAQRRAAELDADPEAGMIWIEIKSALGR